MARSKKSGSLSALVLPVLLLSLPGLCVAAEMWAHAFRCAQEQCPAAVQWFLRATWPELVLDALPAIVVLGGLAFLSANFVQVVHGLRNSGEAYEFLQRRVLGLVPVVSDATIREGRASLPPGSLLARVGGPAHLTIYSDSAVVLEKAGRLTRVVRRGTIRLDAFERVWDVLDLRPQLCSNEVKAMSKDGIPVRCQVDVAFQIDVEGGGDQAIFLAATGKWIRGVSLGGEEDVFDWTRRVVGITEGVLRNILATWSLDQLLGSAEQDTLDPRAGIVNRLRAELRTACAGLGVRLIRVELGHIVVADDIARQRAEAWRALWKRQVRKREAMGEAEWLQLIEEANAKAQAEMIVAITQAFQRLSDAGANMPAQVVLLRIFEMLKRSSFDPQSSLLFFPAEVMRTWRMVQSLGRGVPGEEADEADET